MLPSSGKTTITRHKELGPTDYIAQFHMIRNVGPASETTCTFKLKDERKVQ